MQLGDLVVTSLTKLQLKNTGGKCSPVDIGIVIRLNANDHFMRNDLESSCFVVHWPSDNTQTWETENTVGLLNEAR